MFVKYEQSYAVLCGKIIYQTMTETLQTGTIIRNLCTEPSPYILQLNKRIIQQFNEIFFCLIMNRTIFNHLNNHYLTNNETKSGVSTTTNKKQPQYQILHKSSVLVEIQV